MNGSADLASPDEKTVLAVVAAQAKLLRSGDVEVDRIDVAEALSTLLDHPSPEVREEVAGVCDTFPEPFFSDAITRLTQDPDSFVQNAANRAAERRARVRKERKKDETREQVLAGLLKEIADRDAGAAKLAERAVRRGLEHFIARLDHEVRKSDAGIARALASLDGEIEKRTPSPAALRSHAAALRAHFEFVQSIIRRGCEYTAQVRAEIAEENLAEVVEDARRQLCDRLRERAGALDFGREIDPGLRMDLDRRALLEALQNIFQNAVEAYPADCARLPLHVSARLALAGAQVELRIADRGQGITREGLAKLYLPFGSSKPGGTGLGMPTVRKMIEEVHAGELVVESEVDVGTTVTIRLPRRQAAERAGGRR